MKLSVVAPCLNEEGNIKSLVERISLALKEIPHEIILVNDASTDHTYAEIVKIQESEFNNVKLVNHVHNQGIANSWYSGILEAESDLICFIDADLQNPPEAIPEMYNSLIENQVDVVQGVRSSIGRIKENRFILSRGLNALLNIIFAQKAKDSKSGFILGKKEVLIQVLNFRNKYYHFQTLIGVAIRLSNFRIVEVETLFLSRNVGKSFLTSTKTLKVVSQTFLDLIKGFYLLRLKGKSVIFPDLMHNSIKNKMNFLQKLRFEIFFLTTPLHKWIIGRPTRKYYLWLKSVEFIPRSEMEDIQLIKLRKLVSNAYHNVPYYKRIFDEAGFKPFDLKQISDLERIPLLSKDDVRRNIHFSLFSSKHNKKEMLQINTSGSTGEPFICYADKFQLEMRLATTLRAQEMTGFRFGDRQMRLWHQTLGMSKSQIVRERLDAILLRRKFIPAFEMTSESVESLIGMINNYRPKLIDGYAESLNFIATMAGSTIKHPPAGVISSAQQLTSQTREQIENIFNTKVYDKYGSREFSGIAYQCKEGVNHHVQDESYVVELLVDGRKAHPGEVGEIVITDLNNFSVPLIRYRIGDLAVAVEQKDCKCGRPHSTIGEITGRTQALIGCSNGVWLPGGFFGHFFKDYEYAVKHYQIVQEVFGEFEIRVVPNPQFNKLIENKIIENMKNFAGADSKITLKLVDSIPMVRTGKRSPVVSNLKQEYQKISKIISNPYLN